MPIGQKPPRRLSFPSLRLCQQFDPKAVCKQFGGGAAWCFEGCSFGPESLEAFDPKKCHGRQEIACSPHFSGSILQPACLPQCNSNAECGGGLSCNPATGFCTPVVPTGKPIGEPCSTTAVKECKGVCRPIIHPNGQPFTAVCSEGCTVGASPSCAWAGPGTGKAPAACLFADISVGTNGGPGVGDSGYCGQLCDCNSDCANSALVCHKWDTQYAQQIEQFFGRKGYCSDPVTGDGGVDPGIPACP